MALSTLICFAQKKRKYFTYQKNKKEENISELDWQPKFSAKIFIQMHCEPYTYTINGALFCGLYMCCCTVSYLVNRYDSEKVKAFPHHRCSCFAKQQSARLLRGSNNLTTGIEFGKVLGQIIEVFTQHIWQ